MNGYVWVYSYTDAGLACGQHHSAERGKEEALDEVLP